MKKTAHLLLFLILLVPELGFSQEQKSQIIYHSFTYEIGASQLKEENLFPIVHRGVINGLNYRFEKSGKNYDEVFALLRYSKIKSKLETEKVGQNAQISIGYSKGYHVIKGERISFYMGYNLRYLLSFLDFPVWDESRAYWGTSLTLGLSNRLFISTKKDQCWVTSWDINPMGSFSRPDEVRLYAQEEYTLSTIIKSMNSNFKFGFANNVFLINFRTEYRFLTKKDRYFAFLYSLSYSRLKTNNEHPLQNSLNNFGISLGF